MPGKLVLVVREIRGFERAGRCVVSRVKKQDDILVAAKLGNVDVLHIRIGEDEHRCRLSNFQHCASLITRPVRQGERVNRILPSFSNVTRRNKKTC